MDAIAARKPARKPRKRALWRDPGGRVSALKILCLVALVLPGIELAVEWQMQLLGARPVTEVIHGAGLWTIRLLYASLAITPLAAILAWPRLLLLRRMIGVACALYGGAHLVLYARDQNWMLLHVVSEIALRIYLTIGFVALLGLAALAITSTDGWVRKLRGNWVRLHKLIYLIAPIATLHFFLQSKADVSEPVVMLGLLAWLLAWRVLPKTWRTHWATVLAMAPITLLATALIEAGWYAVAIHADPLMILNADWDISFGLRPPHWAGLIALGVALLAIARQMAKARTRIPAPKRPAASLS